MLITLARFRIRRGRALHWDGIRDLQVQRDAEMQALLRAAVPRLLGGNGRRRCNRCSCQVCGVSGVFA